MNSDLEINFTSNPSFKPIEEKKDLTPELPFISQISKSVSGSYKVIGRGFTNSVRASVFFSIFSNTETKSPSSFSVRFLVISEIIFL